MSENIDEIIQKKVAEELKKQFGEPKQYPKWTTIRASKELMETLDALRNGGESNEKVIFGVIAENEVLRRKIEELEAENKKLKGGN